VVETGTVVKGCDDS